MRVGTDDNAMTLEPVLRQDGVALWRQIADRLQLFLHVLATLCTLEDRGEDDVHRKWRTRSADKLR